MAKARNSRPGHPTPSGVTPRRAAAARLTGSVLAGATFVAGALALGPVATAWATPAGGTSPQDVITAFADATSTMRTITLENDVTVDRTLVLGRGARLTVDLNGHTLTVDGTAGPDGTPGSPGTGGAGAGSGGGGAPGDPALVNLGTLVLSGGRVSATGGTGGNGADGGNGGSGPGGNGGEGGDGGPGVFNAHTIAALDTAITADGGDGGNGGNGGSGNPGGTGGAAGNTGVEWAGFSHFVALDGDYASVKPHYRAYVKTVGDAVDALAVALPSWPTRDGYTLAGWFTAVTGGQRVAPETLAADQTLYAQWSPEALPTCPPDPFSDVPAADTFCGDIAWLKDAGVTLGTQKGEFLPKQATSRQAMAAFLYRLANPGQTAPACERAPFADVPVSNQFCGDIAWLKSDRFVRGDTNGMFLPTAATSRQAMAAYLYRLAEPGKGSPACEVAPFPDVTTSNVFCGDIAWLKAEHIAKGDAHGKFQPEAPTSRQQMAGFLYRWAAATSPHAS